MSHINLVTTCDLDDREFLLKMNVDDNVLEIVITDKNTGDEWQCSYDSTYIENLTQKTGNFKQFDIFVTMLKTCLLKTSDCVSLDILTYDDLEVLRKKRKYLYSKNLKYNMQDKKNRRYLILTYSVEFDKIHYPLPLEYCGPPNPHLLQNKVQRLQAELARVKGEKSKSVRSESKQIITLKQRIEELNDENLSLHEEIRRLNKIISSNSNSQIIILQKAITDLEKSVLTERESHHKLVQKLKSEKINLQKELMRYKHSRSNKTCVCRNSEPSSIKTTYSKNTKPHNVKVRNSTEKAVSAPNVKIKESKKSCKCGRFGHYRNRSKSSSVYSLNTSRDNTPLSRKSQSRNSSVVSSCSSTGNESTIRSTHLSRRSSFSNGNKLRVTQSNLQQKILSLQKMLENNMNVF